MKNVTKDNMDELDEVEGLIDIDMTEGFIIWLTGRNGAGKTTLSEMLDYVFTYIFDMDCEVLDDDSENEDLSEFLFSELKNSKKEEKIRIKRLAYVANHLANHGCCVVATNSISSRKARGNVKNHKTIEIYCDCTEEILKDRSKKQYMKSYEEPLNPDIHLHTDKESAKECIIKIVDVLRKMYPYMDDEFYIEQLNGLGD